MSLVFTLCSNNYLAHALTLGNSVLEHNPGYTFKIGLVDRKVPEVDYQSLGYEIIEAESIRIEGFEELILKYSVRELNTAVKAAFFRYFFSQVEDNSTVIYLDPDIIVFHPFLDLENMLNEKNIVLTPHFTTPISDDRHQQEEDFLNSGLYNLGFIAINKTHQGLEMVDWWDKNLREKGFIRFERGMFTDQIWINFVPLYFEDTAILDHKGYNVAYWNLHERELTDNHKVITKGKEYPLVFYHFSGYSPEHPETLSKYQDRFTFSTRTDLEQVFEIYRNALMENGYENFIGMNCVYRQTKEEEELRLRREALRKMSVVKRALRSLILRLMRSFRIDLEIKV